jgi:hypothetical protein
LLNKTELNSGFALFLIQVPKAKLRFEVLLKKFHCRINLTTFFLTKTYILNTIKPFSGHRNQPLGLKQQNLKNLSEVATLRNLNFKILSMRYIKLAQMTPGVSFLAYKAEAVGVTQIWSNGDGDGDSNGA